MPYFKDGYWYYTRFEPGKEHPIFVRRRTALEAPEEIVLDGNERAAAGRAAGRDYYQIGAVEISPNSRMAGVLRGFRRPAPIRAALQGSARAARILEDAIVNVESDIAWANDNETLLYVEKDSGDAARALREEASRRPGSRASIRSCSRRRIRASTPASPSRSRTGSSSFTWRARVSSEWRYADADDPALEFKVFLPHERDHEYQIEHLGDHFIIRTNWHARNFRLMHRRRSAAGARSAWQDVVAAPRRYLHPGFRCVRALPRAERALGGPAQDRHPAAGPRAAGPEFFIASDEPAYSMALSHQPAARHRHRALRLFLADHADDRLRLRCAHREEDPAQARSGARVIRSRELPNGISVCARARRQAGTRVLGYRKGFVRDGTRAAAAVRATAPTGCPWIPISPRRG